MNINKQVLELARLLMNNNTNQIINGRTYYYLPIEYHRLYSNCRGFGMKKTIIHSRKNKLIELALLIKRDWNK